MELGKLGSPGLSQRLEPAELIDGHSTPVGDVIETSAIGAAFRETRSLEDPLYMYAHIDPYC